MSILLFLIPITILLGLLGVMAFLWSIKSKQYDDLEGSANRILFDENLKDKNKEKKEKNN